MSLRINNLNIEFFNILTSNWDIIEVCTNKDDTQKLLKEYKEKISSYEIEMFYCYLN